MYFLIRTAFWLGLVVLLLPTDPATQTNQAEPVSAGEAIGVVGATVQDLAGFCARNPETCATGSQAIRTFGDKAEYGARMLYSYISEMNDTNEAPVDVRTVTTEAVTTKAVTTDVVSPADLRGTDTLTAEDREPAWRGSIDG